MLPAAMTALEVLTQLLDRLVSAEAPVVGPAGQLISSLLAVSDIIRAPAQIRARLGGAANECKPATSREPRYQCPCK
jgi:hypothetical protein